MNQSELNIVRRAYKPYRTPKPSEVTELVGLVRLLASYGCSSSETLACVDRLRGRSRKADMCGPCHAETLLNELEVR
jgi:hypothetical protein